MIAETSDKRINLDPGCGEEIGTIAEHAIRIAVNLNRTVLFVFNGTTVLVDMDFLVRSVIGQFNYARKKSENSSLQSE